MFCKCLYLIIIRCRRKTPILSVVNVQTTCIPPKETVVYTKQTQTTQTSNERDGNYIIVIILFLKYQFFFLVFFSEIYK